MEGKVHKDGKLEIMTMWVKVIFRNIHKKSDACADSFGIFTFGVSPRPLERNKSLRISTNAQPHLLTLFKIFLAPTLFETGRHKLSTLHDRLQGENKFNTILCDRYFNYRTEKS